MFTIEPVEIVVNLASYPTLNTLRSSSLDKSTMPERWKEGGWPATRCVDLIIVVIGVLVKRLATDCIGEKLCCQ